MSENNKSKELVGQIKDILEKYSSDKYKFIYDNSPDFVRKILNTTISKLLNVKIDDTFLIYKTNHRALYYYELRILVYLRSNNFDIAIFSSLIEEISSSKNSSQYFHRVDLQILEALPIFKFYIKDPLKIDNLIKVHQYISGLWKNGSKYLHFYTLHNEEHSIELIRQSVKITKTIDYLKLKSDDYYILFLACYLHDISMALHPNLEMFSSENEETDFIYSEWKRDVYNMLDIDLSLDNSTKKYVTELEKISKFEIKNLLLSYFRKLDEYFETNIRSQHASRSASFIKEQYDLRFLDKAFLQLVADVSEAHYFNAEDVYKLKSKAKEDLFDIKYIMIVLRLADLLDMTRERISTSFMNQNVKHMSNVSKYHWISHLSINDCHIESEFKTPDSFKDGQVEIDEKIKVIINLNTCQLTSVKKSSICSNWSAQFNKDKNSIQIQIKEHNNKNDKKGCSMPKCNLSCKWFVTKQKYLFEELYELQRYLNRNENNIFKTSFSVELRFENSDSIKQEYLDVVLENI